MVYQWYLKTLHFADLGHVMPKDCKDTNNKASNITGFTVQRKQVELVKVVVECCF